jgi:all-trans-retinol 13,14-reductase
MSGLNQLFDVVIIGSGLGGLVCGAILSKEGKKVCILEKNDQIGGSLQTFKRNGIVFDTGVHYLGGLDKGQNLYQIFSYLGIMDRLKLKRMDPEGFDVILFKDIPNGFPYGMGYDNFIRIMTEHFPDEEAAIRKYCFDMQTICKGFPMYNWNNETRYSENELQYKNAGLYLEELTPNPVLRAVLAGTNLLYAGVKDKTPLYVHALVVNSYIESANRCVGGGDQIAKLLARVIRKNGGTILRNTRVVSILTENKTVTGVLTGKGDVIRGTDYISDIPPVQTFDMIDPNAVRPAYKNRLNSLENSISVFSIYAELKPGMMKYQNRNYYYFDDLDVWKGTAYTEANWPFTYALFEAVPDKQAEYVEAITIMSYMYFKDVAEWEGTHNTTINEDDRGEAYLEFKKGKSEKLLDTVAIKFPGIRNWIKSYYTSSPLSYRDYIGSTDGNMYGFIKDCHNPLKTLILPKTKLSNLLLTGQNINLHGILGVSVSAVLTCSLLVDREYLINKIIEANSEETT